MTYFQKTPKHNPTHGVAQDPIPADTRHTYIRNIRKDIGNIIANKKGMKTIFPYHVIMIKR